MAEHLDNYVADFIDQFEVMHDDIEFGEETKEGSYRYPFSLDYLKKLDKFLRFRNLTLMNSGHMWIGQDIYVLDTYYAVGLAVVISYNEIEQILSFMPHAYFYMEKGRYSPFPTYEGALRFSKNKKTIDMIHEMS